MSCIDCGAQFDAYSVKSHTSCITEAEKYEGVGSNPKRGVRKSSNSYCAICNLAIPGLVAAEQHYNSKKHKKNERAANAKRKLEENGGLKAATATTAAIPKKEAQQSNGSCANNETDRSEQNNCGGKTSEPNKWVNREIPVEGYNVAKSGEEKEREITQDRPSNDENTPSKLMVGRIQVKREMKRILKQQQGKRMRRKKLLTALVVATRGPELSEISSHVSYLLNNSRRFEEAERYVILKAK